MKKVFIVLVLTSIFLAAIIMYFTRFTPTDYVENLKVNLYELPSEYLLYCEDVSLIDGVPYVACVHESGSVTVHRLSDMVLVYESPPLKSHGVFRTAKFINEYLAIFNMSSKRLYINLVNIVSGDVFSFNITASGYRVQDWGDLLTIAVDDGLWLLSIERGEPVLRELGGKTGSNVIYLGEELYFFSVERSGGRYRFLIDGARIMLDFQKIIFMRAFEPRYLVIIGANEYGDDAKIYLIDLSSKEVVDFESLDGYRVYEVNWGMKNVYIHTTLTLDESIYVLFKYEVETGDIEKFFTSGEIKGVWAYKMGNYLVIIGSVYDDKGGLKDVLRIYLNDDIIEEYTLTSDIVLHPIFYNDRVLLIIPKPFIEEEGAEKDVIQVVDIALNNS